MSTTRLGRILWIRDSRFGSQIAGCGFLISTFLPPECRGGLSSGGGGGCCSGGGAG